MTEEEVKGKKILLKLCNIILYSFIPLGSVVFLAISIVAS